MTEIWVEAYKGDWVAEIQAALTDPTEDYEVVFAAGTY